MPKNMIAVLHGSLALMVLWIPEALEPLKGGDPHGPAARARMCASGGKPKIRKSNGPSTSVTGMGLWSMRLMPAQFSSQHILAAHSSSGERPL
jgi:hypothetical protein